MHLSKLPDQSEAESLVLRFQTLQRNCRLFESASAISTAPDKFGLEIMDGRLVLFYNLGLETWVRKKARFSFFLLHSCRDFPTSIINPNVSFITADPPSLLPPPPGWGL
ncbi:unnamed protein product [Dibothriocephalus latus]|uniref:Uncharacterized protein n=1 Tax=Dibothriocephalus latus TaxID=60516 RepID=A0A3P6SM89_DIBLA|nr:unnamed protein product [Dibothriocephalus latus]